jgi:hypothetical protein
MLLTVSGAEEDREPWTPHPGFPVSLLKLALANGNGCMYTSPAAWMVVVFMTSCAGTFFGMLFEVPPCSVTNRLMQTVVENSSCRVTH